LIHWFEIRLHEALFLLPFVPVVMGMGGNIGSQTSTIAVRGLATGRITLDRGTPRQFIWQQLKVGALIGLACAVLAAIAAFLLPRFPLLNLEGEVALLPYALVVGVSLFLAILVASVNGAFIPLVFEKLGIDPAVAAGPLVTTSNDISGIIIYFGLASLLISYLVT
jgi:magnesium transporter